MRLPDKAARTGAIKRNVFIEVPPHFWTLTNLAETAFRKYALHGDVMQEACPLKYCALVPEFDAPAIRFRLGSPSAENPGPGGVSSSRGLADKLAQGNAFNV